jgi:uncharacterized protein (TIGR04141 family)
MAEAFSSLTVFRLHDKLAGKAVTDLADYIDREKKVKVHRLKDRYPFEAKLFVANPEIKSPPWVEPLEKGFGTLSEIPDSVSNSAILILGVPSNGVERHFAATFGFGRYLLRPGSVERNYGLRVALNAIYPSHSRRSDFNRLRSVDSKTVASNTARTRRQFDRYADFESFDVDTERDFLGGLTGVPLDEKQWGPRITGADSLNLTRSIEFHKLGEICLELDKKSKSVPSQFSWVEKIFAVRDSALAERLKEHIHGLITDEELEGLELAPPALVEWGDIASFAFSFASSEEDRFAEPSLEVYVNALRQKKKLDALTLPQLTSGHRLLAFDADGAEVGNWSVFRSLSAEIEYSGKNYVLSEGEFFEVTSDYLAELNRHIDNVDEFPTNLPAYDPAGKKGYDEGDYNEYVASTSSNYLLLDRETVRLGSRTTPIEICDILTSGRALIHVKRKLNSSSLSHLFAQGLVSADLLLTSDEFRTEAREKISALEPAQRRFSRLFPQNRGITASEFTVVYGIVARWENRSLAEALPFFSKVNLRRYIRDIKRMGYKVAYRAIQDNSNDRP